MFSVNSNVSGCTGCKTHPSCKTHPFFPRIHHAKHIRVVTNVYAMLQTHSYAQECNCSCAELIRVVTNAYAMLQTHPYAYGYDMQNVVAGRALKDMDSLVTNTSVYIRMQLPSCKTHPCKYGCVCNAANTSVLLRIGLQH